MPEVFSKLVVVLPSRLCVPKKWDRTIPIGGLAVSFDRQLRDMLGGEQAEQLLALLRRLMAISPRSAKSQPGSQ
jgi:hypothetical protein